MPTNLKFSKKQVIIVMSVAVLLIVIIALMYFGMRPPANNPAAKVTLTVWGTDNSGDMGGIMSSYPYATVNYRQIPAGSYNNTLLSALAAGTGPDVFEIGNRDLAKFRQVLAPLPSSSPAFTSLQLSQNFPDVVAQDFMPDGELYGLPLYLDTLAMVYNKDLFNTAGIVAPPATWDDFDTDVAVLRSVGANGQVAQAGAAIGGSSASIPNAADILTLLMLQNGAQMTSSDGTSATFASQSTGAQGLSAFSFYLQFANPASPYYTWNDQMGNAFDSFAAGKTAIVFAYQSDLAAIKAKAPFLHIGIAPVPQPKGASIAVDYPRYEGLVAAKAGNQAAAWNFILYFTALSSDPQAYIAATGRPPALRTAIQADLNDPVLSVYAKQALSAKSWSDPDVAKVDTILNTAIQSVLTGNEDPLRALGTAQDAVSQLMQ